MAKNLCIEVQNLSYHYSKENKILENLNFSLKEGEIVSVIGPNGCGKTTLLNLIAGFLNPITGKITYNNNGNLKLFSSIVFQDSALLDWKSVFRNVELSLISTVNNPLERKGIINHYLDMLGIKKHQNKLPKELSGGLRQRTAIARALAPNPRLLLLDEPFSALDLPSKEALKRDLLEIIRNDNKSVMMVTHDIDEAIMFSDKILMLNNRGCEVINLKDHKGDFSRVKEKILNKLNGGNENAK